MGIVLARNIPELRQVWQGWKQDGRSVGLVPTMGALHAGHAMLIETAVRQCDRVIVSLFVNPTQFGPNEDYGRYPRQEEADIALCAQQGAACVYMPTVEEMYPDGFATTVQVGDVSEGLCGASRPGHFDGVATVVCKLLNQAAADKAFFGEKDFQQFQVIRRMVADLDMACEIVGVPTVREADGLALSSRNAYLTEAERAIAPQLYATLQAVAEKLRGGDAVADAVQWGKEQLLDAGFSEVEYLECWEVEGLRGVSAISAIDDRPCRLLVAVRLGETRLIDNVGV